MRKDQCDLCCEFQQGNTEKDIYHAHHLRKEAAQAESQWQNHPTLGSKTKIICVDVQRVLLTPALKAFALYYKTKLQLHNYTILDMRIKDVLCYLWTKTEGGLNASEIASCLVSYLEKKVNSSEKVITYSDCCTYHNRIRVLATALRYFNVHK